MQPEERDALNIFKDKNDEEVTPEAYRDTSTTTHLLQLPSCTAPSACPSATVGPADR